MDHIHEHHSELSLGRILEKKVNTWIRKIRTLEISEEMKLDLEDLIEKSFPKDRMEKTANTPEEIIVFFEMFGHQLENIPEEAKNDFQKILDEIEIYMKVLRSKEN